MMWGRVSKRDAIEALRVAIENAKEAYLYGWKDGAQGSIQLRFVLEGMLLAAERIGGPKAVIEAFGGELKAKDVNEVKVNFDEIIKLEDMLTKAEIPHTYLNLDSDEEGITGRMIIYPNNDAYDNRVSDVVVSYHNKGEDKYNQLSLGAPLLEQSGLLDGNEVRGGLTAEEVFECWKQHYKTHFEDV